MEYGVILIEELRTPRWRFGRLEVVRRWVVIWSS